MIRRSALAQSSVTTLIKNINDNLYNFISVINQRALLGILKGGFIEIVRKVAHFYDDKKM
jgi:hypothetical protein